MDVQGVSAKQFYNLDPNIVHFNHGSYGCVPIPIIEAVKRYELQNDLSTDRFIRTEFPLLLRKNIEAASKTFHADPEGFALIDNVSSGFTSLFQSIPFSTDDVIVFTGLTYATVREAAKRYTTNQGTKIVNLQIKIPITSEDEIVALYEKALLDYPKMRMVVIDHITSLGAIVMPLSRLIPMFQSRGVIVVVDGAHAAGQIIDLNLNQVGADIYIGDLHKWFQCGRSLGFIYVKNLTLRPLIRAPIVSWTYDDEELWMRFISKGTRSGAVLCTFIDSLDYIESLGGLEAMHGYITKLLPEGVQHLTTRWGSQVLPVPKHAPYMRTIGLPSGFHLRHYDYMHWFTTSHSHHDEWFRLIIEKLKVSIILAEFNKQFYVRVSTQVYNSMEDFEKLGQSFLDLLKELDADPPTR